MFFIHSTVYIYILYTLYTICIQQWQISSIVFFTKYNTIICFIHSLIKHVFRGILCQHISAKAYKDEPPPSPTKVQGLSKNFQVHLS